MYSRTDDPIADYDSFCEYEYMEESKRPVCAWCGDHCDEYAYQIDGEIVCEECVEECKVAVESLMEG